jgi:ABC-2 type transport system permease protein
VSVRVTLATAQRVLWQIRHDPRTIALLLVVPALLLVLLRYVFDGREAVFQSIGAPLCGLFPFIVMFLITSITMLRERTTGTLERLMSLPLAKLDLLAEFQAVQFMPALIFPQLLLCGLFVDRSAMASVLYWISWALPLTYAYDALARATAIAPLDGRLAVDALVVAACTLGALALGALTLRRRTA